MKCIQCRSENLSRDADNAATVCDDCGYVLYDETRHLLSRFTHNEELRELIQQWRENGADGRTAQVFEICADELEELLDE